VLGSPYLSACLITPVLPGHQYTSSIREGGWPAHPFKLLKFPKLAQITLHQSGLAEDHSDNIFFDYYGKIVRKVFELNRFDAKVE
jgi:hypothetical protein